jgi:site-specific DNA recombinase
MKPEPQRRAAGYIRVSTVSQAREGESLKTQRDSITLYCSNHGLELANIYADEGVSGRKQDRPGLAALLKDASQKAFDCVVVSRLTRFGRSARDLVNNLGALDDHNIRFVSLKENIDTSTPAGRLLRHVLIGIAEFEHETIKDQMLSNRHVRARRGDILIGKPPYGYTWDKGRKCIEINPEEEAVYRRMVGMCLGGKSYRDVAIALRRDGIKAKLALFSSTVVGQILKNPCYYSGRLLRNTNVFKGNQRTKEEKPADQHFQIALPPLIDKITWSRVQERIAFNKVKTKRTTNPNFWLRNVLKCGECGGAIKPKSVRGQFDYYCCYWATSGKKFLEAAGRKHKCRLPSIPAQEIHDRVRYHLLDDLTFGRFNIGPQYAPSVKPNARNERQKREKWLKKDGR